MSAVVFNELCRLTTCCSIYKLFASSCEVVRNRVPNFHVFGPEILRENRPKFLTASQNTLTTMGVNALQTLGGGGSSPFLLPFSLPPPFLPPQPLRPLSPPLPLLSPPLPLISPRLPPFSPPLPSFCPSLPPLRSRTPKIQLEVWGSAVSSPSGVWGVAPAEIEFGAF